MPIITFVGAGSTVFAKRLLSDILSYPELNDSEVRLYDINPERLQTSALVARRVAEATKAPARITTTLDRREALTGAHYVITMFQVGGYEPGTTTDFDIPKRYGLRQTIGDTLGIGGIMRGLRTIPVLLDLCREMEDVCPNALLLQYVNPMAMLMWAQQQVTGIHSVGLCHSVPHTAKALANDIGVPLDEIRYVAAGVNHVAFFLKFERDGQDLTPQIRRVIEEGRVPEDNRVRYEMFRRLGYFVTESSEHFSEYVPYFIKRDRPDLIEQFNIPLDEYLHRCQLQLRTWELMQQKIEHPELDADTQFRALLEGAPVTPAMTRSLNGTFNTLDQFTQSDEYAPRIIHSMETGQPRVIYGNVLNHGSISSLPDDCCVEVPCLVDSSGVQPTCIGAIPPQLSALMQTQINVQRLTVEAALTGKREHIYHAAMLDPHTAAELDLDQIWHLVDDLIAAHGDWLPKYS